MLSLSRLLREIVTVIAPILPAAFAAAWYSLFGGFYSLPLVYLATFCWMLFAYQVAPSLTGLSAGFGLLTVVAVGEIVISWFKPEQLEAMLLIAYTLPVLVLGAVLVNRRRRQPAGGHGAAIYGWLGVAVVLLLAPLASPQYNQVRVERRGPLTVSGIGSSAGALEVDLSPQRPSDSFVVDQANLMAGGDLICRLQGPEPHGSRLTFRGDAGVCAIAADRQVVQIDLVYHNARTGAQYHTVTNTLAPYQGSQ